jgi:hypothetical protein
VGCHKLHAELAETVYMLQSDFILLPLYLFFATDLAASLPNELKRETIFVETKNKVSFLPQNRAFSFYRCIGQRCS